MILPDELPCPELPKIIQPRSHKAKISVWADLTVDDFDRINESLNADHIKMVLADIFHLDDYKSSLKTGIIMDLYYYTLQFAREHKLTKEQSSAFFSIIKRTHEVCVETPFGNLDQTFAYFKDLVLCHAVNRPPHSIELFSADQVRLITEYTVNTYFRHLKMYKYAFTPLVRLDLSIQYVGMPDTPVPSEVDETPDADAVPTEEPEPETRKTPPPAAVVVSRHSRHNQQSQSRSVHVNTHLNTVEESDARKELRGMIQSFLSEEIKKMKTSVEDQLKTTEDLLSQKLDIVEGGGGKKAGKGSAKAGKKK